MLANLAKKWLLLKVTRKSGCPWFLPSTQSAAETLTFHAGVEQEGTVKINFSVLQFRNMQTRENKSYLLVRLKTCLYSSKLSSAPAWKIPLGHEAQ